MTTTLRSSLLAGMTLCALLLTGCAGSTTSTSPRKAEKEEILRPRADGARFLALGDSFTIGEGVEEDVRWPSQLADSLRRRNFPMAEPEIVARTGWTTADLLAELNQNPPSGPFTLVTLQIGVNDQFQGRPIEEFRRDFKALLDRAIDLAGGKRMHVVVVSIPDWSVTPFAEGKDRKKIAAEIDQFNEAMHQAMMGSGTMFVDVTSISREGAGDTTMVTTDKLHPSGPMYTRWVGAILSPALGAIIPERPRKHK